MPGDDLQRKAHTDPFTPPSDPGPYIRTYAKDVAALTNAPPPPPVPAPVAPPVAPRIPESPIDGVVLPEHDPSPVARKDGVSREFQQEQVELSKSDSDGIFTKPLAVRAPEPPAPELPPPPPPSLHPVDPAPDERDVVLARLRERLATTRLGPSGPVTPAPVVTSVPAPEPAPAKVVAPRSESPAPIHTFKSDFSDRIDHQEASAFTVLAAQADASPAAPVKASQRIPYGVLAGLIVLIIGGTGLIGAASYYILAREGTEISNPFVPPPSIVRVDARSIVTGEGSTLAANMRQTAIATSPGPGSVIAFDRVISVETPVGTADALAPGDSIVRTLALSMPSILDRTLEPESVVGSIQVDGEVVLFLALSVSSYERSFAGMLAWEPRMSTNLGTLFGIGPEETSTSIFIDTVTGNLDARVLRSTTGQVLVVYGYPNKDTLIITRSEAAYRAIAARLVPTP